ncbi:MAG: PhoH family protein [Bacteroidetes bacterium]|nr:PhoH family protein [Bacteroidota bacterium]
MSEKILYLEDIDPVNIYGSNNSLLNKIIGSFPKLKIIARGSEIKVIGEESLIAEFEEKFERLIEFYLKYNRLEEADIDTLFFDSAMQVHIKNGDLDEVLIFGNRGQPIKARTVNQIKLVKEFFLNDLVIVIGPAGTGKTYLAIAMAVRALRNKEVEKIILTRPAVEAGEHLGFLPGDVMEKLEPYLQPLYDALKDMITAKKLAAYIDNEIIQIAPLAYMRGRTLENAVVILDEAQNSTVNQLKMFLTRMGQSSKFIVTGDITQIDLPGKSDSGLWQAVNLLKGIDGISILEFDEHDIVRHKLVKSIVRAYDEKERQKGNQ